MANCLGRRARPAITIQMQACQPRPAGGVHRLLSGLRIVAGNTHDDGTVHIIFDKMKFRQGVFGRL